MVQTATSRAIAISADFDIEIVEAHHRTKKDAPSGTALGLGKAAAEGRGMPDIVPFTDRSGERHQGDIGYAVIRGGDIVGDHTVLFAGTGEQITLGHRATDRAIFARGAARAALWLARQSPGRYIMRDFLGLKTST